MRILDETIYDGSGRCIYAVGTSSETKPTDNVISGSIYFEVDTSKAFMYNETSHTWIEATGSVDEAAIEAAVAEWLEAHPEATTTVADGSITEPKLASALLTKINNSASGVSQLSDEIADVDFFDDLIRGSLNSSTGEIQTSTNRCVNQNIRQNANMIKCTCSNGYSLYVLQYNDDSTVSILTSWTSEFIIPANTKVRMMVRKNDNSSITVTEAVSNTDGKSNSFIAMNIALNQEIIGMNLANNYFDYSADAQANDGSTGSRFDADALTASDVYSAYDALLSNYPAYITKNDLGMDASNTYHIYQYTFAPPSNNITNSNTAAVLDSARHCPQKILITSGTHGNGSDGDHTDSIISVYNLVKKLCDGYQSDPMLTYMHWNVEVDVIPCVNPWGVTNESRLNANGVDINRNFDAGWSSGTNRGTSAASEAETQILQVFFDNNTDATCHIETHTRGGTTWQGTSTPFIAVVNVGSVLRYVMQSVIGYLRAKFSVTGSINCHTSSLGMIIDYSLKKGIPSVLLECAYMSASTDTVLHSKETDRRNTEFCADTWIKSLQWFFTHTR